MSGIPMYAEEGAALRLQLESMLKALRHDQPNINRQRDPDALELIIRLQAAYETAAKIEQNAPALSARRGVSLAKVRTLTEKS